MILLVIQWFLQNGLFPLQSFPLAIQPTQPKFPQPALSLSKSKSDPLSLLPLCKSIETARGVQSQCPCSGMDVTGEPAVRLEENPCSLSCSPQLLLPCRKEQSFYGCKSQNQSFINGWEFCKHWQISKQILRYVPDARPPFCQILNPCHSVRDAKILIEKANRAFKYWYLFSPLFLLEMDESGWVFFFLPHISPHQCKTLETGEEILTWRLSPATSVTVRLFPLAVPN